MKIHCHTCGTSFEFNEHSIIYDNGTTIAIIKCPHCNIIYAAVDMEDNKAPVLFKMVKTKSFVIPEEKSAIIKPDQASLIVSPAEYQRQMNRSRP